MKKLIPYNRNLCSRYATKMLSIKINNACNRSCSFCVDKNGRDGKYTNIEKIAAKAISFDDYKTIVITGGEPFLIFDETVKLITKLKNYKEKIILNTNGSLLSVNKIRKLNGIIDELQVSIHHYDEKRNGNILNGIVCFENIKNSLTNRDFVFSINSNFNNEYTIEEMPNAVNEMVKLAKYLNADKIRFTELKKVPQDMFISANNFFSETDLPPKTSDELITKGCTHYCKKDGIKISVKRLCDFAKGENAIAFSCCFINEQGQKKIDVDTEDTFKVIYSDGLVTNDWIFNRPNNKEGDAICDF